jgi:hypothetical protein
MRFANFVFKKSSNFSARLNCTDAVGQPVYVTDYTCRGNLALFKNDLKETEDKIKDARVSFLSGHASFSFQVSVSNALLFY